MVATADFPQHTAGASPCAHVPEGSGSRIADYGCRFAFKDGVLWCNAIPDLPQLATCCVDMVLLAYNQFCSASHGKAWQALPATTLDVRIGSRMRAAAVHTVLTPALLVVSCMCMLYGVHAYGRLTSVRDPLGTHCV